MDYQKLAVQCAKIAEDKKATDILILDVSKLTAAFNYLVICSGQSDTQVRTIGESIEKELKKEKQKVLHREGLKFAHWILLDYGGVLVNVFHKQTREFYQMEKIWADGIKIKYEKARKIKKGESGDKKEN